MIELLASLAFWTLSAFLILFGIGTIAEDRTEADKGLVLAGCGAGLVFLMATG